MNYYVTEFDFVGVSPIRELFFGGIVLRPTKDSEIEIEIDHEKNECLFLKKECAMTAEEFCEFKKLDDGMPRVGIVTLQNGYVIYLNCVIDGEHELKYGKVLVKLKNEKEYNKSNIYEIKLFLLKFLLLYFHIAKKRKGGLTFVKPVGGELSLTKDITGGELSLIQGSERMSEKKCVTGCKHFEGGEIKHHKDCDFYPDSLSKIYDDLKNENSELIKAHIEMIKSCCTDCRESATTIWLYCEGCELIKPSVFIIEKITGKPIQEIIKEKL